MNGSKNCDVYGNFIKNAYYGIQGNQTYLNQIHSNSIENSGNFFIQLNVDDGTNVFSNILTGSNVSLSEIGIGIINLIDSKNNNLYNNDFTELKVPNSIAVLINTINTNIYGNKIYSSVSGLTQAFYITNAKLLKIYDNFFYNENNITAFQYMASLGGTLNNVEFFNNKYSLILLYLCANRLASAATA